MKNVFPAFVLFCIGAVIAGSFAARRDTATKSELRPQPQTVEIADGRR